MWQRESDSAEWKRNQVGDIGTQRQITNGGITAENRLAHL